MVDADPASEGGPWAGYTRSHPQEVAQDLGYYFIPPTGNGRVREQRQEASDAESSSDPPEGGAAAAAATTAAADAGFFFFVHWRLHGGC
jgi:hypothetical protein